MSSTRYRDVQVNLRFTTTGKELFERLRAYYGLSQSGLVEMLVRDKAREIGLVIPGSGEETALRRLRDSLQDHPQGVKPIASHSDKKKAQEVKSPLDESLGDILRRWLGAHPEEQPQGQSKKRKVR